MFALSELRLQNFYMKFLLLSSSLILTFAVVGITNAQQTLEWFVCGNGIVENGERCDDGNNFNSDGCTSKCRIERGYQCKNRSEESSKYLTEFPSCLKRTDMRKLRANGQESIEKICIKHNSANSYYDIFDNDCIEVFAVFSYNVDLCEQGQRRDDRETCIARFRTQLGRLGVCERMRGKNHEYDDDAWWERCYMWAARDYPETSVCDHIRIQDSFLDMDWFGYCYTNVAIEKKDISICDELAKKSPRSTEIPTCRAKVKEAIDSKW